MAVVWPIYFTPRLTLFALILYSNQPPTFDVRLSEYEGSDVAGGGGGGALPDMLETEPLSADKVERLCARAEDLEQPVVAAFNQVRLVA